MNLEIDGDYFPIAMCLWMRKAELTVCSTLRKDGCIDLRSWVTNDRSPPQNNALKLARLGVLLSIS
jgi:hypothetical protein